MIFPLTIVPACVYTGPGSGTGSGGLFTRKSWTPATTITIKAISAGSFDTIDRRGS